MLQTKKKIVAGLISLAVLMGGIGGTMAGDLDVEGTKTLSDGSSTQTIDGTYDPTAGEVTKTINEQIEAGEGSLTCDTVVPILEENTYSVGFKGVDSCIEMDLNSDGAKEIVISTSYTDARKRLYHKTVAYGYNKVQNKTVSITLSGAPKTIEIYGKTYLYGNNNGIITNLITFNGQEFQTKYNTNGLYIPNNSELNIIKASNGNEYAFLGSSYSHHTDRDGYTDQYEYSVYDFKNNRNIRLGKNYYYDVDNRAKYQHKKYLSLTFLDTPSYNGIVLFGAGVGEGNPEIFVISPNGTLYKKKITDVRELPNWRGIKDDNTKLVFYRYSDKKNFRWSLDYLRGGYLFILDKSKLANLDYEKNENLTLNSLGAKYKYYSDIIGDGRNWSNANVQGIYKTSDENMYILAMDNHIIAYDKVNNTFKDISDNKELEWDTNGDHYNYSVAFTSFGNIDVLTIYKEQWYINSLSWSKNKACIYNKITKTINCSDLQNVFHQPNTYRGNPYYVTAPIKINVTDNQTILGYISLNIKGSDRRYEYVYSQRRIIDGNGVISSQGIKKTQYKRRYPYHLSSSDYDTYYKISSINLNSPVSVSDNTFNTLANLIGTDKIVITKGTSYYIVWDYQNNKVYKLYNTDQGYVLLENFVKLIPNISLSEPNITLPKLQVLYKNSNNTIYTTYNPDTKEIVNLYTNSVIYDHITYVIKNKDFFYLIYNNNNGKVIITNNTLNKLHEFTSVPSVNVSRYRRGRNLTWKNTTENYGYNETDKTLSVKGYFTNRYRRTYKTIIFHFTDTEDNISSAEVR